MNAMPSYVGFCVLEFLVGRDFAFFNVLSIFFGQCADTPSHGMAVLP